MLYRRGRGRSEAPPAACELSEAEVRCIRLASELAEERHHHGEAIARMQRTIDGLKQKLREAHARLSGKGG